MTTPDPEQMRALEQDAHDALQEAIDNGGRLRMTIPAELHKDTDLRIARALASFRAAADQLEAVQRFASIRATAAHALGREVERDWLDLLTILTADNAHRDPGA